MKFSFKKIASVLASAVMLGSTLGIAAAASYPAPFVSGGAADVAVVVGAAAASSDYLAAVDLGQNLQAELAKQTTGTTTVSGTTSGEVAQLFTSATKIYLNDTLNAVKSVVTETDMPTLLTDGTFSGNVDATTTQTIDIGKYPEVVFDKQPTSSDDPTFGLKLGTTAATQYIYNVTVTLNKAVNMSHADSEGEKITLMGREFTVSASTDDTNLVLLKSAEKVFLDSESNPSAEVTIAGNKYTVELVAATDTTATVKITDSSGTSEQKEITEERSKKVNGITVAVNSADESTALNKISAEVVAGAEKLTFTDGSSVTTGEDDTIVDGTVVRFIGTAYTGNMTQLRVSVTAPDSDEDAITPTNVFVDPVFGSFKVDFAGLSIPEDGTSREDIIVRNAGDDKMELVMKDHRGDEATINWAYNHTTGLELEDSNGRNITVLEREAVYKNAYVVVGNEDEGYLLQVSEVTNQTTGYSNDKVKFKDMFSGDSVEATITAEGTGTVNIGGKVFSLKYFGANSLASEDRYVKLNYPDSGSNNLILYPTIQTSKGAKVAFYEEKIINLSGILADSDFAENVTNIKIPNGDTYDDTAVTWAATATASNFSIGGVTINSTGETASTTNITVGNLTFMFEWNSALQAKVYLITGSGAGTLTDDPALIIWEEKDDNSRYEAMIVTLEEGGSGDDGIGVEDVERTWSHDASWDLVTLASDSKKTKDADLWGSIALIDSSDSDQKKATISYPDEQVYAQIYVAEEAASITPGEQTTGTVTELGSVTVEDTEVSSVSSKNLVVVGGSCVNTVAAKVLGSETPLCGEEFTTASGAGANQALVKVVTSPYSSTKVAMLVAGYEAVDTERAVKYVTSEKPATDVGTSLKLSTASSTVSLVQ